jgi:ElaB/YqjD/DUF883 family membrane-anchored ribosome-binding protein
MSDEALIVPAAEVAPVAADVVVAPAVEAPAAEAVVTEAAPVVVEPAPEVAAVPEKAPSLLEEAASPADEAAPKTEAKPEEAKPTEAKEEKPAEEKPVEVEAKTEEAATEEVVVEKPVLEPVEYEYVVPENIVMDDARKAELHTALDAFRADPKTGATALLDLHNQTIAEYAQHTSNEQHRIFNEQVEAWRTQSMGDEQFGGAAWKTSSKAIARARDAFVSRHPFGSDEYKAERQEFINMLDYSGVGNHPAMLRMLHNVARFVDEPAPPIIGDVKQVPERGKRSGNPLHDNPRSQSNGRG